MSAPSQRTTPRVEVYYDGRFWGYRKMLGKECVEWSYGYPSEAEARDAA